MLLALSAFAAHAAYHLEGSIDGPKGGFDYLTVDGDLRRLFVAREYGIMAVDLDTQRVIPTLVEGAGDAAVVLIPGTTEMLSTNGEKNTATIFDRKTGKIRAVVPTGSEPDAALYDPASRTVFVMNGGSHDVTLIDPAAGKAVATVPLGEKPEAAASDAQGRVFINLEESASIAVVDARAHRLLRRYPMRGCHEPTGLAFDPESKLLISACHNRTAKLIRADDGADRGVVRIGQDADGAIFDAARRLVYVPAADGWLTVFRLGADGRASGIERVSTAPGARTAALDPVTGRIYLARRDPKTKAFQVLVAAP